MASHVAGWKPSAGRVQSMSIATICSVDDVVIGSLPRSSAKSTVLCSRGIPSGTEPNLVIRARAQFQVIHWPFVSTSCISLGASEVNSSARSASQWRLSPRLASLTLGSCKKCVAASPIGLAYSGKARPSPPLQD